jgi:hypothetical protein
MAATLVGLSIEVARPATGEVVTSDLMPGVDWGVG